MGALAIYAKKRFILIACFLIVLVGVFVLFTVATSNSSHNYLKTLVYADSLCNSESRLAVPYLKEIRSKQNEMSEKDSWYYRLICVKALDKFSSEGINKKEISDVLSYYTSHGADKNLLGQAYYYMGRSCAENNDIPTTLDFYYKAMDNTSENDLRMIGILNFQIGYLLLEQSFYNDALPRFKKAYEMEKLRGDTAMMVYCLQKIGYTYQGMGIDSCRHSYEEAISLSVKNSKKWLENEVRNSLADYYLQKGHYAEAKEQALPVLQTMNLDDPARASFYDIIGKSYMELGQTDSALFYYEKLSALAGIEEESVSSRQLSRIYYNKGDLDKAFFYLGKYEKSEDSLRKTRIDASIAQMNALYNYTKYKVDSVALSKSRMQLFVVLVVVLSLTVCASVCIFFWYRNVKHRERMQMQNMQRLQVELEKRKLLVATEKESRVDDIQVKKALACEETEKSRLQKENSYYQRVLQENKQELERNIRERFKTSEIYKMMSNCLFKRIPLSLEELLLLDSTVQVLLPDFVSNLNAMAHVNKYDIRMCALMRLTDFNSTQISQLLGRHKSTISKARKRLFWTMFGREYDMEKFDVFLKTL